MQLPVVHWLIGVSLLAGIHQVVSVCTKNLIIDTDLFSDVEYNPKPNSMTPLQVLI
jgi:hypothetical protein